VNLDWTVLTALNVRKTRAAKRVTKQGEAQLKLTIITRISDVNATYFDLVQQQQQLNALDSTIVISNQRLTLAQNRFTIGKAKLAVLNAK
jgi:outer membrane protein TolC